MTYRRRLLLRMRLIRILARLLVVLLESALVAACGTLPPQVEQPPSRALAPAPDSPLVRVARDSTTNSSMSGFRLMPQAYYSLDVRIELARRATHSLDVQYYLIQNDRSGRLLMRTLRDAALARGASAIAGR